MKKTFTIFVMLVLVSSFVLAAENQERNTNDDTKNLIATNTQNQKQENNDDINEKEDSNKQDEEGLDDSDKKNDIKEQAREGKETISQLREQTLAKIKELKIKNATELREAIKGQREVLKEAVKEEKEKIRGMKEKQNEVRLAVQTLLASENLTGGIGKEVSAIAKDFDNSAKETESVEEKIMNRGRFMKVLFGGDRKDAELIRNKLQTREEKIQQLEELVNTCNCTDDVKVLLQEQIQIMKQEQERLKTVADNEGSSTGLLGWMFK
mgnify:CR=1 FL=1